MTQTQIRPPAAVQSSSPAGPRTIREADGRTWRVTAVRPDEVLGERRHASRDRRVVPVESLLDPPVLERRRGPERRVANERRHALPGLLLPPDWREGWLLFETDGEVRRLAPIPADWARASETELSAALSRAARRGD